MNKLTYTIEFFSDWHCGSGLSAGADVDALVVKDENGLPFVPGKTIKGLVREQLELLGQLDTELISVEQLQQLMGYFDDKDKKLVGTAFFSNAILQETEMKAIISNNVQKYLYRSIANTKIDNNGIAQDKSLRKMEVTVPCKLTGFISDVPDELVDVMNKALKLVKRLGQNRNRGLGRCHITINTEG